MQTVGLIALVLGAIACLGFLVWLVRHATKAGQDAEAVEQLEEVLDDVETAKRARDAMARNPDERQRVRDRYTRR